MDILLNVWLYTPPALRLRVYYALITIGHKLCGSAASERCHRLPFNLYAKEGLYVSMDEANAMRHIKETHANRHRCPTNPDRHLHSHDLNVRRASSR